MPLLRQGSSLNEPALHQAHSLAPLRRLRFLPCFDLLRI
ncbi:hypothetical protein LINPERPRIM_LOCUS43398 [Linum perenne]